MDLRKITIIFVSIIIGFFFGCQKPSTPIQNQTVAQAPTATEVFNLRNKCAELGEKIIDGNQPLGSALRQEQVSHYDPKTNRCYVELNVHMADLTKYQDYY